MNGYGKAKKITPAMDNLKRKLLLQFMKYLNPKKQRVYGIGLNLFIHLNTEAGLIWVR
jgi:hypothetical protein